LVKTIVALLLSLLVLVGPAAAQDADPQEDPAPDGAEPAPDGAEPAPDGAEPTPEEASSAATEASEERAADGQQAAACRAVATHIADPRMSPNRWVITDPDGCIRRTIERLIGPSSLVRRIL
jgi:hypothetical protein